MTLIELAERVERASGPGRRLDGLIWQAIEPGHDYVPLGESEVLYRRDPIDKGAFERPPAFTASIDAAMTLVPEAASLQVTRGMDVDRTSFASVTLAGNDPALEPEDFSAFAATPALALVAAALRARATQENG